MTQPFGSDYADCYDSLYRDKDYEAECDLIERVLRRYSSDTIGTILDLGCGTGNHALPLARRGFAVSGVDRSKFMLDQARSKAAAWGQPSPDCFYHSDIRNADLGQQFDAVLLMFAVLGYQLRNTDVVATLHTARRHLRPGGVLLFDIWYGPAVLAQRPSDRVKILPNASGKVLRTSTSQLETMSNRCTVHYHVWKFAGQQLLSETEEEHSVRYFFPMELDFFLESTGFTPIRLGAFPEFDRDPDEHTWNALCAARAV